MTLKAATEYRVAAKDRAGQWNARIAANAEDTEELTFSPAEAEVRTTDIISKAVSALPENGDALIWKLELAANTYLGDKAALYAGQVLAENCLAESTGTKSQDIALRVPDAVTPKIALRSFDRRIRAASGRAIPLTDRAADACIQIAASIAGMLFCALLILRGGGSPAADARPHSADDEIFAMHGESTTRTRHIRDALAADLRQTDDPRALVLLLGRPKLPLDTAIKALDPDGHLSGATFVRPFNFTSFLTGLPRALSLLRKGIGWTAKADHPVAFRERVAIAFRMVFGAAQAAWWRSAGLSPQSVYFGHTGTADTSQLERAIQHGGARSVHCVHGTNIGWSFAGISDAAIFQSGADADAARRLPAYGYTAHIQTDCPELAHGNGKWAVLTSYTHLLNPDYSLRGAASDIELIEMVAQSAKALGQAPADILWRPHPQIEMVDAEERQKLLDAVARAGFQSWPDEVPYSALGTFGAVITTPSTVLTDALRQGKPAIAAAMAPLQSDLVYNAHPLLVRSRDEMETALRRVTDPQQAALALAEAWAAVRPGGPLEFAKVRNMLAEQ